jgi:hypothetical protein
MEHIRMKSYVVSKPRFQVSLLGFLSNECVGLQSGCLCLHDESDARVKDGLFVNLWEKYPSSFIPSNVDAY